MARNVGFRGWMYFRQGWSTYFAFVFAAVNTMVVTYYLAIENIPFLKDFFPTFYVYFIVMVLVGVPTLILVGYAHFKKTASYKAEADIFYESNPHALRSLVNTELLLELNLQLSKILMKILNEEKLSNKEIEETNNLKKTLENYLSERSVNEKKDSEYFKELIKKTKS